MKKPLSLITLILFLVVGVAWGQTAFEWFGEGVKATATKNHDEAIRCYKKSIELNPNDTLAHYFLGRVYHEKGMLDKAITEYKKTLAIDPNHTTAHYDLGFAYHNKNMLDEAITEYKKTLAIDPDYVDAHLNLGEIYHGKGKFDEAIVEWKKTIVIDPNDALAHFNLGVAYYEKGFNVDGAEYLYKSGLLYLKEGNREGALKAYEALKQIGFKKLEQALFDKLYPEQKQ